MVTIYLVLPQKFFDLAFSLFVQCSMQVQCSIDKLNIPFFRSATGQRSFSYRAAQLWNDLPESLTNMESFNVFKNAIKGRAFDEFLSH